MSSTAETEFHRSGLHPALGYKNSHDAGRCFLRPVSRDTCGGPLSSCPRNLFDKLFLVLCQTGHERKKKRKFIRRRGRSLIIFTIDADSRREFWEILFIIISKEMLQYYF